MMLKRLLGKRPDSLFATRTLAGHLLRGAAAFGLLATAIGRQDGHGALSMAAGLLALVLLRGCPVCWLIGLVETVQQRRHPVAPGARSAPYERRPRDSTATTPASSTSARLDGSGTT